MILLLLQSNCIC